MAPAVRRSPPFGGLAARARKQPLPVIWCCKREGFRIPDSENKSPICRDSWIRHRTMAGWMSSVGGEVVRKESRHLSKARKQRHIGRPDQSFNRPDPGFALDLYVGGIKKRSFATCKFAFASER